MTFCTFDAEYLRRLAEGDVSTETHFSLYFQKVILLKLRARRMSPEAAEDICQETVFRVLKILRQGGGITHPERFGAFVNSVCNNVLLEFSHKNSRHPLLDEKAPEPRDERIDLESGLVTQERRRIVREVLEELPAKDRDILKLVFFDDAGREGASEKLGVKPDYLRVLLHRAKAKFEAAYLRRRGHSARAALFLLVLYGLARQILDWRGLKCRP